MIATSAPSPETIIRTGLAPAPNIPNPRNAGRKKSNPVWEFFTDLRTHGLAGVRCRFCHWVTNDRSPTTMKFHLKRKHDTGPGGLWAICEEKINSQAPANYAPRTKKAPEDALIKALSQQQFNFSPFVPSDNKITAQDDFFAALIQQASQYANSSTSPSANSNEGTTTNENESISLTDSVFLNKLNNNNNNSYSSSTKEEDSSSSSVSGITTSADFNLGDGSSIASLLQIASDSDLIFTFNSRKIGEYCFESNQKNNKMVTLTDCGNEIRVAQLENDEELRVENWRKSDWLQFTWAVRGTCLHFLKSTHVNSE